MPVLGRRGRAEISYYYSTTPSKTCNQNSPIFSNVTKPVIVVDGIDHLQERNGRKLFNEYLFYRDGQNREQNLGTELRDEGYDVVIMDHPLITRWITVLGRPYEQIVRRSGSDYMERNGYVLVKLIQELNRQMRVTGSTEQIVVVGPSMGGQIARFALAYMEKRYNDPNDLVAYHQLEWQHNTRLYIALDSPHNGANIPLGLQHFVRIFAAGTEDLTLDNGLAELNSDAARELAQQHHDNGTSATASLPDPRRTTFMNTLTSFGNGGYPSQLRRVAVVNGALDGTRQRDQNGQELQAGQQAMFLEQKGVPGGGFPGNLPGNLVRLLGLGPVARLVTTASARLYYAPGYGQVGLVARTYLLTPGASSGERTPEGTGLAGSCSLDGAPGGYRMFFGSIANQPYPHDEWEERTFYSVRDRACFIPTLSGLGYTQAADNCQAAGMNLVCAGTTAFDAYYGPTGRNEDHIQLTPGNVEFMRNEILRKTPPPVFTAAPTQICGGLGTVTFTLKQECLLAGRNQSGTIYNWSLGAGATFVNGGGTSITNGGLSQQVRGDGDVETIVPVTVTATRAGYQSASTVVYLHVYNESFFDIFDPGNVCQFAQVEFTLDTYGINNSTIRWTTDPASTSSILAALNGQTMASFNVNTGGYRGPNVWRDFRVTVTATGICGNTITRSMTAPVDPSCTGNRPAPSSTPALQTYPNPVTDVLTVYVQPASQLSTSAKTAPSIRSEAGVSNASLYNSYGLPVRQVRGDGRQFQVITADLPNGVYYLVVSQNGQLLRKHIQVAH